MMSANPLDPEAVTEKLSRLKRLATAAMFLAAASLAAAVIAVVASHNATMLAEASLERIPLATPQATPSPPSQSISAAVEARRFVLRDNAGRVRAELGVEQDNRAELTLRDPDGTLRAVLATADSGTGAVPPAAPSDSALLGLFDHHGRRLVSVWASETLVSLTLFPSNGNGGGMVLFTTDKDADIYLAPKEAAESVCTQTRHPPPQVSGWPMQPKRDWRLLFQMALLRWPSSTRTGSNALRLAL
jgi:hypothetical protein